MLRSHFAECMKRSGLAAWRLLALLFLPGFTSLVLHGAETPPAEARKIISEWVQTRKVIARTRAEWNSDKALMEQQIALLERELAQLREQIKNVDTNIAGVAAEEQALTLKRDTYKEALETVKARLALLEKRILSLEHVFPPVLRTTVQPLLHRIPTDTSKGQVQLIPRVLTLITLVNELDKFNSTVTIAEEVRTTTQGEKIAVDVIYAGFGQAWFSNKSGDYAGFGVPSEHGWEWTVQNELAPVIQKAIRIYRNELPAELVSLPVKIR
ncbi:MAG: DUF3450 domain-containing protein [Verrucomicrobiae bacterium]|nr:DUF3450 domain-containing protein [Verrucomicrobiae bacterium]